MPQTVEPTRDNVWYKGICDELLFKVALWEAAYWTGGSVHSTRQWLDPRLGKPVDKPVKMAHFLPFREVELEHLVRIVEALKPGTPMVDEVRQLKAIWHSGKAVVGRRYPKTYWTNVILPPGIHRVITVAFYPEHVTELVKILNEAKTGKKADEFWKQQKEAGKDLFEQ